LFSNSKVCSATSSHTSTILQRLELALIGLAVAVGIDPDLQLGKRSVSRIDHTIVDG
jgi:hypothetical protein